MPHTPAQRDRHNLCNARKKNGERCRKFAGEGTDHPGTGACKYHGGRTPNHSKAAIKRQVTQQMVMLGEPDEDVTALGAMMYELAASSGHTGFLRQQLKSMSKDELASPYGQTVSSMYNQERDRRVRIARMCIESGVDEAAIRVAEAQVSILGQALSRACDTAGVSAPLRQRIGEALRDELAAAEAEPQPLRLAAGSSS